MNTPIIVSIEANIGAGKSTIIEHLQKILDPTYITCIQEPIKQWNEFRDLETNKSLLELFYTDPPKYALPLQTMIYNSLDTILQKAIQRKSFLIITERSLQSSRDIFAKMLHESGVMSSIDYQVYMKCVAYKPPPLHVCIYLRTTPEICHKRVEKRNRQGEQEITLDYLRTCYNAHEQWISSIKNTAIVHVIDVSEKTPDEILTEVLKILEDITHI